MCNVIMYNNNICIRMHIFLVIYLCMCVLCLHTQNKRQSDLIIDHFEPQCNWSELNSRPLAEQ